MEHPLLLVSAVGDLNMTVAFKTLALIAFTTVGFSAQAANFRCGSKDGKLTLVALTRSDLAQALTQNPTLSVNGKKTEIFASQYKNTETELFVLSVMDETTDAGVPVQRIVKLDVKVNAQGIGRGTLSVHTDFGGRVVDPARSDVSCKVE